MPEMSAEERVRDLYDEKAGWWRWTAIPDSIVGMKRLRKTHMALARGSVLDVACGTGENFKYLNGAESITAFDISPRMVVQARERARKLGVPIEAEVADATDMPYESNSFDYVVSAFSSCTFPDYVAAFQEMERVTQPRGTILLVEHGRSSVRWIARRQDRNVEQSVEKHGCRVNRDPFAEVTAAGLVVGEHQRSHLGMAHRFIIEVSAG